MVDMLLTLQIFLIGAMTAPRRTKMAVSSNAQKPAHSIGSSKTPLLIAHTSPRSKSQKAVIA
jgi:hypothetical protein